MAATIYYDNVGSYAATINDGSTGSAVFSDSNTLENEENAVDENLTTVVGDWVSNEGLQFDLGSAITVSFCAIYSTVATSNDITIYRDDASSGPFDSTTNILTALTVGWNIRVLSSGDFRYRTVSAGGNLTGIAQIFFGNALELPIQPTANIVTEHKFGTEEIKTYGANKYYINKHDNYKILKLSLDHMTTANKTSLLTFSNTVTNRKPFIYSEDGTTGPLHYVRLVAPLTFKQVAPDVWSCQIVMRELLS